MSILRKILLTVFLITLIKTQQKFRFQKDKQNGKGILYFDKRNPDLTFSEYQIKISIPSNLLDYSLIKVNGDILGSGKFGPNNDNTIIVEVKDNENYVLQGLKVINEKVFTATVKLENTRIII